MTGSRPDEGAGIAGAAGLARGKRPVSLELHPAATMLRVTAATPNTHRCRVIGRSHEKRPECSRRVPAEV